MEHKVGGKRAADVFEGEQLTLVRAACRGDRAGVRDAVRAGANANAVGEDGVTPLLWAVSCENEDGIEALLEAGAKPNVVVAGKFSAVFAAATMRNVAPLQVLLRRGGDPSAYDLRDPSRSALVEALEIGWNSNDWRAYRALLEAGADINHADAVGNTVATHAIVLGEFGKVSELLERGYVRDLPGLARSISVREINAERYPKMAADRAKVIQDLADRGIVVPKDEGRAR